MSFSCPKLQRLCRQSPACLLLGLSMAVLPVAAHGADPAEGVCDTVIDMPLFDAHMHYNAEAWEPYPPATAIGRMDAAGVAMALVSSTPDDGTIMLMEHAPDRVVPELRPHNDEFTRSNWTRSPLMMGYLEQRMQRFPHRGIGEFILQDPGPLELPFMAELAALAIQHDAILHIHSGEEEVAKFYGLQPGLKVIWAHAGMIEPREVAEKVAFKNAEALFGIRVGEQKPE